MTSFPTVLFAIKSKNCLSRDDSDRNAYPLGRMSICIHSPTRSVHEGSEPTRRFSPRLEATYGEMTVGGNLCRMTELENRLKALLAECRKPSEFEVHQAELCNSAFYHS
jgi:hypothetical protein